MSDMPPLRFITQEDGLTIFNGTDENGVLRRFVLNPDQEKNCIVDLVTALARRGYAAPPERDPAYQTSGRKQGIA